MKYYVFNRTSNDFSDILTDPSLKNKIFSKIKLPNRLLLGVSSRKTEELDTYLRIKYNGEISDLGQHVKDLSPVPHVDYIPRRPMEKKIG